MSQNPSPPAGRRHAWLPIALLLLAAPDVRALDRHDVLELSFTGSDYENAYTDAPRSAALFEGPSGQRVRVPAFWDGGNLWKVRFAPDEGGLWRYSVKSADPLLREAEGSFDVTDRLGGLLGHGAIHVDPLHPHRFVMSDGTPFFFLGHSIDWNRQGELGSGQYERIVRARSRQGFTVLVGYAGPGLNKPLYAGNEGGPPVQGSDLRRLNPAYFRAVDRRLEIALEHGLTATMALSFADQGIWKLDRVALERVWRHVVARYAAYPILWQPIGEYNEGSLKRTLEIGELTRRLDPFHRPQSMHAGTTSGPLAGHWWFDFIIHQGGSNPSLREMIGRVRSEYRLNLPIVEEEYRETRVDAVREAAWRHYANGAYYTLTAANYVIEDERTTQLGHLRRFFDATRFGALEPHPELADGRDCLADPGREYVVYSREGGPVSIRLEGVSGPLSVRWLDPRTGRGIDAAPVAGGGTVTLSPPFATESVLHLRGDGAADPRTDP